MRTYLEHLTTADLIVRYRQIAANLVKAEAAPREFGAWNDTIAMRKGRWTRVSGAEATRNGIRCGLDQTVREICSRFIPA